MMKPFTIIGIHDSGLGWIVYLQAKNADDALQKFKDRDKGIALAVFEGIVTNQVNTNVMTDTWKSST